MGKYEVGALIKRLRTERGMSQEQICEGICSQSNYSKIESGEQSPHENLFDAILQRLGLSMENYYGIFLNTEDFENFTKKQHLNRLLVVRNYHEAASVVAELENIPAFKKGFNLQFLLSAKASVAHKMEKDYQPP